MGALIGLNYFHQRMTGQCYIYAVNLAYCRFYRPRVFNIKFRQNVGTLKVVKMKSLKFSIPKIKYYVLKIKDFREIYQHIHINKTKNPNLFIHSLTDDSKSLSISLWCQELKFWIEVSCRKEIKNETKKELRKSITFRLLNTNLKVHFQSKCTEKKLIKIAIAF